MDERCAIAGCRGCEMSSGCERCGAPVHEHWRICEDCAEKEEYEERALNRARGTIRSPIIRKKEK